MIILCKQMLLHRYLFTKQNNSNIAAVPLSSVHDTLLLTDENRPPAAAAKFCKHFWQATRDCSIKFKAKFQYLFLLCFVIMEADRYMFYLDNIRIIIDVLIQAIYLN